MKRFGFMMLLILLFPISGSADSGHMVINEIQTGSVGNSNNEFIKLYNATTDIIDLNGWSIQYRGGASNTFSKKNFVSGNKILPNDFFLIANSAYEGESVDLTHSSFIMSAVGGTIFLVNNKTRLVTGSESTIIDKVGYGTGNLFAEGTTASAPPSGQSIKRNPDGYDTDNNANDFVITGQADDAENIEDNSEASNLDGVYINELMPDPESPKLDISDEWIELYNNSDFRVDLSGARLKDSSNSEGYKIADGIFIEPKRYAIFYSSATRIQLNNSGDSVKLLDRNGTIVDETPDYGKAEAGLSFALFEDGWKWTKAPTPLSENVFEAVLKEAESKKAAVSQAKKKSGKRESGKNKRSLGKSKKKSGKVKGEKAVSGSAIGDEDFLGESSQPINNKTLGMVLVSGAAILGFSYLIFREKVYEYFKQKS